MPLDDLAPSRDSDVDALPLRTSARHKAAVIYRIRALMEFWNLTVDDLRSFRRRARSPTARPAIKYRHPHTGATWDGRGGQPEWLRQALLKEGLTVDELRAAVTAAVPEES